MELEYLFVLDYNVGTTYRYTIDSSLHDDGIEDYLMDKGHKGHNPSDCNWMITRFGNVEFDN